MDDPVRAQSGAGSGLAVAGTLLPRPLPANTPQRVRDEALVDLIRIKMGFPREVFEPVVSPIIEGYAVFVHRPPATESRPQGRYHRCSLPRTPLQVGSRALDFRRGQILPRGGAGGDRRAGASLDLRGVCRRLAARTRHEGLRSNY
ncbi:MAG: TraI domain-containing protein [Sulfuritalea sp.]|nr:TraI domain-containing protein [Sulfuritalea sp.]